MSNQKAWVFQDFFAVYLFDQDKNLTDSFPFERKPEEIAEILKQGLNQDRLGEIKHQHDLKDYQLKQAVSLFRDDLGQLIEKVSKERNERTGSESVTNLKSIANNYDQLEIDQAKSEDKILVQATKAKEEITETLEVFANRVDGFSSFIDSIQGKEHHPEKALKSIKKDSEGSKVLTSYLERYKDIEGLKQELEDYIEQSCERIAPNLNELLGSSLAAKVIAHAGSLEKLAKMPSSTIQVLGAEKALFRHLKENGSPPKHGILFLHPYVNHTPKNKRGKIARFIANKTAIAARLDNYGGDFRGDKLKKEIKQKYEQLNQ